MNFNDESEAGEMSLITRLVNAGTAQRAGIINSLAESSSTASKEIASVVEPLTDYIESIGHGNSGMRKGARELQDLMTGALNDEAGRVGDRLHDIENAVAKMTGKRKLLDKLRAKSGTSNDLGQSVFLKTVLKPYRARITKSGEIFGKPDSGFLILSYLNEQVNPRKHAADLTAYFKGPEPLPEEFRSGPFINTSLVKQEAMKRHDVDSSLVPIPEQTKQVGVVLARVANRAADRSQTLQARLVDDLLGGRITPVLFRSRMRDEIVKLNFQLTALANGGLGNFGSITLLQIHEATNNSLGQLDRFMRELENKTQRDEIARSPKLADMAGLAHQGAMTSTQQGIGSKVKRKCREENEEMVYIRFSEDDDNVCHFCECLNENYESDIPQPGDPRCEGEKRGKKCRCRVQQVRRKDAKQAGYTLYTGGCD